MKTNTLILCMMLLTSVATGFAQTSGTCGENLTWTLNSDKKTLTISGTGAMRSYSGTTKYGDVDQYNVYLKKGWNMLYTKETKLEDGMEYESTTTAPAGLKWIYYRYPEVGTIVSIAASKPVASFPPAVAK
jgi:outer membrane lipoprotein-sorting protein